jgi:hypothetical protein
LAKRVPVLSEAYKEDISSHGYGHFDFETVGAKIIGSTRALNQTLTGSKIRETGGYRQFSRIFEKNVIKKIAIKLVISILPPFLCSGFISENCNQEGKIPDENNLLHTCFGGDVIKVVLTFRIFIGIASHP